MIFPTFIGLIELPEPITFTDSIRPANLSIDCSEPSQGDKVIAVGNGQTEENPKYTDNNITLRYGLSEVLPVIECAHILHQLNNYDWLICTGSEAKQFALRGDSGKSF